MTTNLTRDVDKGRCNDASPLLLGSMETKGPLPRVAAGHFSALLRNVYLPYSQ